MYSAETYNPVFNRYFCLADVVLDKGGLSGEAIVDLLDRAIQILSSPKEQWKRFKKHFLGQMAEEVEPGKMQKIQSGFMRLVMKGGTPFEERLNQLNLNWKNKDADVPGADLAIEASDAADKLLELFG